MPSKLSEEKLAELTSRLASETDTQLSRAFEVSRKTIWRLRQALMKVNGTEVAKPAKITLAPPLVARPAPVERAKEPPLPLSPAASVLPKVDVEPTVLSTYFGVQILRGDTQKTLIEKILMVADRQGLLFRKIQVLDQVAFGAQTFLRVRSDLPDAMPVVSDLAKDRAIIAHIQGTYIAQFPDGRTGKVPTSTMCSSLKTGFGQVYAGTRIKKWKTQFKAENA